MVALDDGNLLLLPLMKLKNHTNSIPGGFFYVHPVTHLTIGEYLNLYDLVTAVHDHEKANGLPFSPSSIVEDQVCQRSPEVCLPESPAEAAAVAQRPVPLQRAAPAVPPPPTTITSGNPHHRPPAPTFKDVLKATRFLGRWLASGLPKVTRDAAAARAAICMVCSHHSDLPGCTSCKQSSLRGVITTIVGAGGFPGEAALGVCGVCTCALAAKVQIPASLLKDELDHLPPHCWIVTENQAA
jgi:hypothetical protein